MTMPPADLKMALYVSALCRLLDLDSSNTKSKVRIRYGNKLLVLSVHIKGQLFRIYRQLPVEVQIMINFYDYRSYPATRQVVLTTVRHI